MADTFCKYKIIQGEKLPPSLPPSLLLYVAWPDANFISLFITLNSNSEIFHSHIVTKMHGIFLHYFI